MNSRPACTETEIYLRVARAGRQSWTARRTSSPTPASALRALLHHVRATVPHYRRLMLAADERAVSLDDFPVVTRDVVAADPDGFTSTAFRADTEDYFAFTNGTVRRKLRVGFDLAGWFDFNYATYTRIAQCIPGLRARLTPGSEAVTLIVDNPAARPMCVVLPTLGEALLRQLVIGADQDRDRADIERLRRDPVPVLYGKPSGLKQLAALDAALPGARRIRPCAVLTSGENLYPDDRRRIEEAFQAPVYNAYIATEGGLLGVECSHRRGLHVPDDRALVELLDERGTITTTGSGAVLVTNLANWGQPFVRYRLGDHGTVDQLRCPCGHTGTTIVRLWGGDARRYAVAGHEVDTDAVTDVVQGLPIVEFQVDDRDGARLRLAFRSSSPDPVTVVATHESLSQRLARRFPGVAFEVVPVTRITPPGGKARRFPEHR